MLEIGVVDATRFLEAPSERFGKLEGLMEPAHGPGRGSDADRRVEGFEYEEQTSRIKKLFHPSTVLPMCHEPRAEPRSVRVAVASG